MNKARLINQLGRVPFLGAILRWLARRYPEGSVVKIKNGHLTGYKWKRSHRYVSSYWLGTYELPVQNCLVRELNEGDVFYDIGANAGFFSMLGSKCVGDKGHVFAFEPLGENIENLKSQIEVNQTSNCTIVEAAVSDQVGEVQFCEGSETATGHIKGLEGNEGRVNVVKTITLNEFTKSNLFPYFIKMDIEGAEFLALQGACGLLTNPNPPKFLIELHGDDISKKVRDFFEKENYCIYTMDMRKIDSTCIAKHVLALPKKSID